MRGLHDLTDPANVIPKKDGSRQCRPCQRAARSAADRRRRDGEPPLYPWLPSGQVTCGVEDCQRPRRRAGAETLCRYCSGHWQRYARYGETFPDVPLGYKIGQSLPESRAELQGSASS